MNNVQTEKARLRAEMISVRTTLKDGEKDAKIAARFFASPFFAYGSFFVYLSFRTEADTMGIIGGLLSAEKTVCVPRLEGKAMQSVPFAAGVLETGAYGILQPRGGEDTECEVAIVPLLAADEGGNRLGYGGGYYDRYIASHPNIMRVGICYEGQVVSRLPAEDTDMRLDALITESRFIRFPRER